LRPTQRWWTRVVGQLLTGLSDGDVGIAELETSINTWIDDYQDDGDPSVWYDGSPRNLRPPRKQEIR
jgi:hypothetical protein